MKNTYVTIGALIALLGIGALAQETSPAKISFADNGQQLNRLAGRGVVLADLNGDGFLDAFVVNENTPDGQGHHVYFGDGRGHFTCSGQVLANPSNWYGKPAIGDVDGDGKPDVVTGKTVWLNDGKGHFTAPPELIESSGTGELGVVSLADLNHDGSLDLFAIYEWKSIRVYLNDRKGHFHDIGQRLGLGENPGSAVMASVALGDVDGDGAIDAVVGGWRDNRNDPCPNRVWLNDGKGNFRDSGQVLNQDESHVHGLALGDVNGDGCLDLVMALVVTPDRAGKVYLNDGKGHFNDSGQNIGHQWAHGVALGDFNGDGYLDIFLACGFPRTGTPNEVWLNDGKGKFRDGGLRLGNAFSSDVAVGDLNGDGKFDAFVSNLRLVDGSRNPPVFGGVPAELWLNTSTPAGDVNNACPAGMRLEWTYFIGGSGEEQLWWPRAPYLDRDGMLYLPGTTKSADFPTTPDALYPIYKSGSQQWGTEDIYLLKFNTRQPGIAYSTFMGGAKGPEHAADIYVDHARNVYIVGNTGSSDYPTTGDALIKQFQGPDFRHADGFLTILSNDGHKMKYSTFIGGPKNDGVSQVFVEPSGEIILFGDAGSLDVLPADVIRPKGFKGSSGSFVMKLDAKGQRVFSSRLLGEFVNQKVQRLDSGDFLIVGTTTNPEIPTTEGVFNRTYHGGKESWGGDIFVMKLSADLKTVSFATLFGGAGDEAWPTIAAIAGGDFFVIGKTTSKDLPVTADAIEKTMESNEALFLARFRGDGRQLKYCTYLAARGEGASSSVKSLVYDGRSRIYFAGTTTSPRFPVTPDAAQATHHGGRDAFLLAFNIDNNSLAYGSYLGGSKDEWNPLLALDENGAVYVVGATDSDDFPTLDKTPEPRKGMDIFISKFTVRNDPAKEKR